ncbi:MAG: GNAT family N-acetyltransferase [Betaproteobacteria bacterium]
MDSVRWTFQPAGHLDESGTIWDEFNDRTLRLPLLSAAFVRTGLLHFGNGSEQLAIASDDQGIAAACVVAMHGATAISTFQPSQFPVGPWLQRPDLAVADLAGSLIQDLPGTIVLASLTQLDPLLIPRPADGPLLGTLPFISTGTIALPATLDEYIAGRSENLRANLRRRQRKIEREHGPVSLQVISRAEDVAAGIDRYSDLESAGWKARLGTALARGNVQWRFYMEAMQTFCRIGQGRIYVLRFGDSVAAASLVVVARETVYLLKTTHNEGLRSVAPGMILRQHLIASLYADESGVRRVEIYGSVNEAQRPWLTGTREMYHANFYRGPVLAALHTLSRRIMRPFRGVGLG